jgi:hypothetical protein
VVCQRGYFGIEVSCFGAPSHVGAVLMWRPEGRREGRDIKNREKTSPKSALMNLTHHRHSGRFGRLLNTIEH